MLYCEGYYGGKTSRSLHEICLNVCGEINSFVRNPHCSTVHIRNSTIHHTNNFALTIDWVAIGVIGSVEKPTRNLVAKFHFPISLP